MRKMYLTILAPLALAACGGTPATVVATAGTDTVSTLDAGVQELTQIDKGIALCIRTSCAPVATTAKLQTAAHKAMTDLLAAQSDASQAQVALNELSGGKSGNCQGCCQ